MLFDPDAHEPLTQTPWSAARAEAAIDAIAADAEAAYDPASLWPAHPLDLDEGPLEAPVSVYLGAAGVIWALAELGRGDGWASVAAELPDRYRAAPAESWGAVPSLLLGEAGILLVAHRLAPSRALEQRLLALVTANARNPTRELLWGSPGTMLAAAVMAQRTGDEAWRDTWRESADWLVGEWHGDLWRQDMYDVERHYIGAGHGFASNAMVLARGGALDERRAIAVLDRLAQREGDLAQWAPTLEPATVRTQWCHGAPGIVTSFARIAPGDGELTALLVAGGELTWRAGPLAKGAGLCHGTAGNGFAFLKLHERTGDERWLARARAFAMHAAEQVERARAAHGRGRYTLWTGDLGTAVFLRRCVDATAAMPTLDDR